MRDFKKLNVWQKAHLLTLTVYEATRGFPKSELFGLTSQIRRACVSIEANIAEGCGRWSDGEMGRFLQIAAGSISELECHFLIARDLKLLDAAQYERLQSELQDIGRMSTSLRQRVALDQNTAKTRAASTAR